jgi:hypothetical protein
MVGFHGVNGINRYALIIWAAWCAAQRLKILRSVSACEYDRCREAQREFDFGSRDLTLRWNCLSYSMQLFKIISVIEPAETGAMMLWDQTPDYSDLSRVWL